MKKYLAISAAFVAFSAQPLQITDLAHFGDMGLFATADAGNGKGGGNGGGNGGSNGGGNGGNHGNSEARGNAGQNVGDDSDGGVEVASIADTGTQSGKAFGQSKEKSLHAALGRLNSMGRNINGLMKSKDPHMAEIRTFILNSVELSKAQTALAAAEAELTTAQATYDAAVAAYDAAVAAYDAALADPNTAATADASAMDAALAEMQSAEAALTSAQDTVTAAEATVAEYEALTSDTALADALASSSNKNISGSDVTSAMLDWSKSVLGVGDQTGAIDAYMAKFQ